MATNFRSAAGFQGFSGASQDFVVVSLEVAVITGESGDFASSTGEMRTRGNLVPPSPPALSIFQFLTFYFSAITVAHVCGLRRVAFTRMSMPHTWDDRTGESKEGIIGVPESAVPRMRHDGFEPVKSTGAHTWATCDFGGQKVGFPESLVRRGFHNSFA